MIEGSQLFKEIQAKFQFDQQLTTMLNELAKTQSVAYIDDFDLYFNEFHGNEMGFDTTLGKFLENTALKSIITVTRSNYNTFAKSYIGKFFEPVFLDELTEEQTIDVLKVKRKSFEDDYALKIDDVTIHNIIGLGSKYVHGYGNPGKSFNILESACAHAKINSSNTAIIDNDEIIIGISDEIDRITKKIETIGNNGSPSKLITRLELNDKLVAEQYEYNKRLNILRKSIKPHSLNADNIRAVISRKTQIPIDKLTTDKLEVLRTLENKLNNVVIGQKTAVSVLSNSLKRNSIGIRDINKPIGVFLFVGPTGTGKTYLSEQLAAEYFSSSKNIVRLDMSEYSDKTSVNKLFGTAPGYIGYENGGILTSKISEKPYTVLLLDEIEKAHDVVFQGLLQVFDDGHMTDNKGNVVSFRNTIIIMTSNIGTHKAAKKLNIQSVGFVSDNIDTATIKSNNDESIMTDIKNRFSPEFINRIDNTIIFNNLSSEDLGEIIKLELDKIAERMVINNYHIKFTPSFYKTLLKNNIDKINKDYGAREVKRILHDFELAIANSIINKEITEGIVNVNIKNAEFVITNPVLFKKKDKPVKSKSQE